VAKPVPLVKEVEADAKNDEVILWKKCSLPASEGQHEESNIKHKGYRLCHF
jgi:hypothetical protein